MMATLSAVLWFLTHHAILSFPLILLAFVLVGAVLAIWRGKAFSIGWVVAGFLAAMANVFLGHFVNAWFLQAEGVEGRAVIVDTRETGSTLNDQNIWAYRALLKTADGRDVVFSFDTMNAAIYPLRNEILIPPAGESFAVKYVPGFARNVVILSDESSYGRQQKLARDREPVDAAASLWAASPANPVFTEDYRRALQTFLAAHRTDADPQLVREYEQKLQALAARSPHP